MLVAQPPYTFEVAAFGFSGCRRGLENHAGNVLSRQYCRKRLEVVVAEANSGVSTRFRDTAVHLRGTDEPVIG